MSGRIVEDVAAVYQGRIRTVAATEPILRGPHGPAAADELVDAHDDALLVLRVQVLRPPSPGRFNLLGRKSEHLRDVLVHPEPVRLEVPVPHDVVGRPAQEAEPFLAPSEGLLGPHPLGHVEGHADGPEDRTLGRTEGLDVHVVRSALPIDLGGDAFPGQRPAV